jgi:hypothetical protein
MNVKTSIGLLSKRSDWVYERILAWKIGLVARAETVENGLRDMDYLGSSGSSQVLMRWRHRLRDRISR